MGRTLLVVWLAAVVSGCGGDDDPSDAGPGLVCRALPADQQTGDGPAPVLLDPAQPAAPADLGLEQPNFEAQEVVQGGRTFHVLQFDVTTFEASALLGPAWRHHVFVVTPAPDDPMLRTDVVAVSANDGVGGPGSDPTWSDPPTWWQGTANTGDFLATFGSVASAYGVPFVAANAVPSAIDLDDALEGEIQAALLANDYVCDDSYCVGELTDEKDVNHCLTWAGFLRRDPTLAPFIRYALAESRIIDAAQEVVNTYFSTQLGSSVEVSWDEAVSMGCSKRGIFQPILAAIDPRVVAVLPGCADGANAPVLQQQRATAWNRGWLDDPPGAGVELPADYVESYLATYDLFRWQPSVLEGVAVLHVVGTNDLYFGIWNSLDYQEAKPPGARMMIVPNAGHTMGLVDAAASFRALVDQVANGVDFVRVEAEWDTANDAITAEVDAEVDVIELWCSSSLRDNPTVQDLEPPAPCQVAHPQPVDGSDLRQTRWEQIPLEDLGGGRYRATGVSTELSLSQPACVVRAVSQDGVPASSGPLLSAPLCESVGLPLE